MKPTLQGLERLESLENLEGVDRLQIIDQVDALISKSVAENSFFENSDVERSIVQIVTGDNEVAGVQRHAAWLARTSKFRHTLLVSHAPVFEKFLESHGVPFFAFKSAAQCLLLLRNLRPSCVHAHLGKALILGACYKKFIRQVPFVYTQHILLPRSSSASGASAFVRRTLLREAYACVDLLVAVSHAVEVETRKRQEHDNIQVVLNGATIPWRAEPRTELLNASEPLQVLGLSRMEPEKRPEDFIEVARRIDSHNVTIKVYGGGRLLETVRAAAQEKLQGIATKLVYAGYEANIENEIKKGELFLHFGREEACPLALIEVQRQGLPVVTYGLGGNVELVLPGNGVLLAEGDYEGAAKAVRQYASNRKLLFDSSNRCRAFAKELTQENNTKQIDEIYDNVMQLNHYTRCKNHT